MMLSNTDRRAQLHQCHGFSGLGCCTPVYFYTPLFLVIIICAEGILQADALKKEAQYKHSESLFPTCSPRSQDKEPKAV